MLGLVNSRRVKVHDLVPLCLLFLLPLHPTKIDVGRTCQPTPCSNIIHMYGTYVCVCIYIDLQAEHNNEIDVHMLPMVKSL